MAARNLLTVAIVSTLGLGFAWLAGSNSVSLAGYSAVFVCALVALGVNWIAFIPSAAAQTDRLYDTIGAVTGGAAGAIWGVRGLPQRWLDVLRDRREIEALAEPLETLRTRDNS